jgi:NADPH:quinone reductase-like Zn-dependent oxidoreductase
MKALQYHEYGGPEVLKFEDAPMPEPGPGEALVKVSGSGINPVDWKIREGKNRDQMPAHFPQVINREFSGTIVKLGSGVSGYNVGDPIYGIGTTGTCAEYVLAKPEAFAHAPATMELPATGGIPLAAMTAWQGLFDLGGLTAGQKVLIQAASGGVGTFAVQFAKYAGAYVYATASSNRLDIVQELGADRPIDYKSEKFEEIATEVDVVLDLIGGETGRRSLACLKKGGILVSSVHDAPVDEAKAQGKRAVNLTMKPSPIQLEQFSSMIQDLKLKPLIDAVVPFDRAIEAENQVQEGHSLGKIVIDVRRETIGV